MEGQKGVWYPVPTYQQLQLHTHCIVNQNSFIHHEFWLIIGFTPILQGKLSTVFVDNIN